MDKSFIRSLTLLSIAVFTLSTTNLYAKKSYSSGFKVKTPRMSFKSSKQSYTKKRAYEGMGKKSNNNGQIKTKAINGHGKRTSKGYTYVQPYVRTK